MRSRNIKPGFFKNEILGTSDPLLTIVFAGLWCAADREGRIEDRPLRLKAEILPYRENIDFNGYLTELARLEFIRRYENNGIAVIEVINFKKHQNPHPRENPSELAEYCEAMEKNFLPRQDMASSASSPIPLTESPILNQEREREALADKSQDDEVGSAPSKYAFEGQVMKITRADLRKWEDKYPCINVIEHLKGIEKTYAARIGTPDETKNVGWFFSVQSSLHKANVESKSKRPEGEAWV